MELLSQNNVTPKAHVLRTVAPTTIWPGNYLEVDVPKSVLYRDVKLAVELHLSGTFDITQCRKQDPHRKHKVQPSQPTQA